MEWKGEKDVAAAVRYVGDSWDCGERRGNVVFVEFRRRRERVLITVSACFPAKYVNYYELE